MDLSREETSLQHALLRPSHHEEEEEYPTSDEEDAGLLRLRRRANDESQQVAAPHSSFHRISFNCSNFLCGVSTATRLERYLEVLDRCRFVYLAILVLIVWPAGSRSFRLLQEKVESSFQPIVGSPSGIAQDAFSLAFNETFLDPMNPPLILVLDSRNTSLRVPSNNHSAYEHAYNFSMTLKDHLESLCWKWQDTANNKCANDGNWIQVSSYYSMEDDLEWLAKKGFAIGETTVLVQVEYTFPRNETSHHKRRILELMEAIDDYYRSNDFKEYFSLSYTGVKYFLSDLVLSARHDLKRMDAIVLPVALVLMGIVLPKANPFVVWIVPIITLLSTVSLWSIIMNLVASYYAVSTFAPTVMMSLTMGMGIDYSLFLLSRYLQNESIPDMIQSMSRVLGVSGLTLACSFAGLMILPVSTLQSIGFGAVIAIGTSLIVNLVTVPILLMTPLGTWIIKTNHRQSNPENATPSVWFRIAKTVLHPYRGTILLLLLCQPITFIAQRAVDLKTSLSFDLTLPSKSPSLQTYHRLSQHFGAGSVNPYKILIDGRQANLTMTSRRGFEVMGNVVKTLERVGEGTVSSHFLDIQAPSLEAMNDAVVSAVSSLSSSKRVSAQFNGIAVVENVLVPFDVFVSAKYCSQMKPRCELQILRVLDWLDHTYTSDDHYATVMSATLNVDPFSEEGLQWLDSARAAMDTLDLGNVQVYIDGSPAIAHDAVDAVYKAFPRMMLTTCIIVFCLMGWFFRSLIAPLRSLVSIGTTVFVSFGLAVAVFQDHWFHWAGISPGVSAIGWLVPIMTFSILVGLTLDYDVFLISRILEYRMEGYEHKSSIALGLDSTGGVITAAGLIMALAFGSLMGSSNPVLYQWSFLLTTAILLDTFVVRTLIVPILMQPQWSWWPRTLPEAQHVADGFDSDDELSAWMQRLEATSEYERLPRID